MPLEREMGEAGADVNVDEVLGRVESESQETQDRDEASIREGAAADDSDKEAEAPKGAVDAQKVVAEYEIIHNGKKVKAPIEKVLQWASQGYDYPQKMQQFNQTRAQFEEQKKQWEAVQNKYKPIEDYIQKDPSWWDHVQNSFQSKISGVNEADPNSGVIRTILDKLDKNEKFISSLEEERNNAKIQNEDKELESVIEATRKEYPNIDLTATDESGKSLLLKVLEHGVQNGIRNFRAAFRDFNHDILVKQAEEKSKELASKETQKRNKLGLIGTSPTPRTKQMGNVENIKNKSYEDIHQEILKEFGIR